VRANARSQQPNLPWKKKKNRLYPKLRCLLKKKAMEKMVLQYTELQQMKQKFVVVFMIFDGFVANFENGIVGALYRPFLTPD